MLIRMAWQNIRYRFLQNLVLIVVTALAVGVSVFVLLLNHGLQQGMTKATEPFDLLIGAKGSDNQLVLNSVFLQDRPIGNIPYAVVNEMKAQSSHVQLAVPLAFGDNYRGFRIVGTTDEIFSYPIDAQRPQWLQLEAGRSFSAPGEAVLGAETARLAGLTVGDEFQSVHGLSSHTSTSAAVHKNGYTVVGILKRAEGPYDQAILVPIESVWDAHHREKGKEEVTAIMIKPKGYKEALQLYQAFQKRQDSQMVFPAQVIVRLFSMMGQGEKIWTIISAAAIVMTVMVVMLVTYWSGLYRLRELAIIKALGGSARQMMLAIIAENSLIIWLGACCGWLLGEGIYWLARKELMTQTAVTMGFGLDWAALAAAAGTAVLGIAGAMIPAWVLSRREISRYL